MIEPVAARQEAIALLDMDNIYERLDLALRPKRLQQDVALGMAGRLFLGKVAPLHFARNERLVPRQLQRFPVADKKGAAVADMPDRGAVLHDEHARASCCHALLALLRDFGNLSVHLLEQLGEDAAQAAKVDDARLGVVADEHGELLLEPVYKAGHGDSAGDLAVLKAADPVANRHEHCRAVRCLRFHQTAAILIGRLSHPNLRACYRLVHETLPSPLSLTGPNNFLRYVGITSLTNMLPV